MQIVRRFLRDERGATAIEYGLIAALVSVVVLGVLRTVGTNLTSTFTAVSDALAGASAGGGGTSN